MATRRPYGTGLYSDAVQRMVLNGLEDDGVDRLASLSLAILSKLDPDPSAG